MRQATHNAAGPMLVLLFLVAALAEVVLAPNKLLAHKAAHGRYWAS